MIVNCVGPTGIPPDGPLQCVVDDAPPIDCNTIDRVLKNNLICVSIGTIPYEVPLEPLASGAHVVTILQGTPNAVEQVGGSQFFLPRKSNPG